MPVAYEVLAPEGCVLARYSGEVTAAEIMESFAAFQAEPAFSFDLAHVLDASAVTGADFGFSEVFALFSAYSRAYDAAGAVMRVAMFAPSEVAFGLARIFENLSETTETIESRLFDDLDAARRWARSVVVDAE